jgi:hypothetical protein
MKAISRRLSVATPPETNPKHNASHRDASLRRVRGGTLGVLAGILSGCSFLKFIPVAFASLDHRLIAAMPPASDVHLADLRCLEECSARRWAMGARILPRCVPE